MSRERARTMRSGSGLVNARGPFNRSIRAVSLLAIGTLVAAACTTSGGRPSSAEPGTEPSTTPAAGAVSSACTPGSGIITTVAGSWPYEGADDQGFPAWRSRGDGGPATQAQLDLPSDVAVDASGNLYILETSHGPGLVRKVDPSGQITTVVGPPTDGASPGAGEASRVDLQSPWGITLDAAGTLYVGGGNGGNSMVVRVDPSGEVTTVAGTGEPGFSGDGGPATEAQLNGVQDLAFDQDGNLYIADEFNNRVRKVSPSGADAGARGLGPRVRKVDPSGIITTVAGNGEQAFSGDGGVGIEASLDQPLGVTLGPDGALYIADFENARVRKVCL